MNTLVPECELDLLTVEEFVSTKLSFRPFFRLLKEYAQSSEGILKRIYEEVLNQLEQYPELQEPIYDTQILQKYPEVLSLLKTVIFPLLSENDKEIFALSYPVHIRFFYYSEAFEDIFIDKDSGKILVKESEHIQKINSTKLHHAYKWILGKYYGIKVDMNEEVPYSFFNKKTGLLTHYLIKPDKRFLDVNYIGTEPLPKLEGGLVCDGKNEIIDLETLQRLLPLNQFEFEGFGLITVKDITAETCLHEMKNIVLRMPSEKEEVSYSALSETIKVLLGTANVQVNLIPYLRLNDTYVNAHEYHRGTMFITPPVSSIYYEEFQKAYDKFLQYPHVVFIPNLLNEETSIAGYLIEQGFKSYLMYPIQSQDRMLGVLEIASASVSELSHESLTKINSVLPILEQALDYHIKNFDDKIERLIKQKFTSLQPSVEWKFNEVAWEYLKNRATTKQPMGNVVFEKVYPLYGAIDIRNSSIERNKALQQDFMEQLLLIQETLEVLRNEFVLPLLDELNFKNDGFIQKISEGILPDEEMNINFYFEEEIQPIFKHLQGEKGKASEAIAAYFAKTEPFHQHIFTHRNAFEDSLTKINATINNFLEEEREILQEAYPNYFEKYKTDGVEYNIYIGQSIAPNKPFNPLYLKNLRLWQLISMAKIVKMTEDLIPQLPVPLHTTQLILIHSNPIDISFRKDERRFDTEGAYNLRYEIMKKRIDKALIKNTGERLTQPGKIAMVYANHKDAEEYVSYITYLQSKNILSGKVEHLELEEMQGVYGLKALRVEV